MGSSQSTHTTMEINDLPLEKEVTRSSVSGRKSNEDLRLVEPALISVQDEVVETLDEEDYESDYMDSDDDDDDDDEGKRLMDLLTLKQRLSDGSSLIGVSFFVVYTSYDCLR